MAPYPISEALDARGEAPDPSGVSGGRDRNIFLEMAKEVSPALHKKYHLKTGSEK